VLLWAGALGTGSADSTTLGLYATVSVGVLTAAILATRWMAVAGRRLRVAGAAASCAADLLQRNTRRLQALLDSTFDPLLLVDAAGRIQAAGRSTERLFGQTPEDLAGASLRTLLPDFDTQWLSEASQQHLPTSWAGEFQALRPDGEPFTCEITLGCVVAVEDEADAERLFLLQLRDLTRWRARELERLHSHKMESIGQLAAGIAHEINTPTQYVGDNLRYLERALKASARVLGEVGASAQTRVRGTPRPPIASAASEDELRAIRTLHTRAPEAIEEALEGVAHIAAIVRTMASFAYPDRSGSQQASVLVDVNQAIHETLAVARNEWRYVARIELDLASSLPEIRAVPGEIHQILLNLLVNAAHAMADRHPDASGSPSHAGSEESEPPAPFDPPAEGELGAIRIATRLCDNALLLEIEDSGAGIPSSIRGRIFDPFFTTKPVRRGTGQGRAITHAIVRRHGGSIDCRSRVGHGTRFSVRLPVDASASDT